MVVSAMTTSGVIKYQPETTQLSAFYFNCNTLNVYKRSQKVLLLNSLLFSFFSYPHRCYFCLSSKTFNELSSVSSSYSDNSQGPPHELPHKSTASSFHWETPYSPASLLTVYNQICLLLYLPLMGFFKHVLLCWLLQKKHAGLRDIK